MLARIGGKGARFRSLAETWADTTTERGRLISTVIGGFADFERELILAQTREGRARARARGHSPAPASAALDVDTERAARAFMQRIAGKFPAIAGIVFGSRARGAHKPDSDADLAVILTGDRGNRYEVSREMAGIAFDVMLETGILVQAVPLWEGEMQRPERFSNPALIENIKREGVRL